MKKIVFMMCTIIFLCSCTQKIEDNRYVSEDGAVSFNYVNEGYNVLTKDTDLNNNILELTLEPMSGSNVILLSEIKNDLEFLVKNELITLKFRPISILNEGNELSPSILISSYILSIAEYQGDFLWKFLNVVFKDDFFLGNQIDVDTLSLLLSNNGIVDDELKLIEDEARNMVNTVIENTKSFVEEHGMKPHSIILKTSSDVSLIESNDLSTVSINIIEKIYEVSTTEVQKKILDEFGGRYPSLKENNDEKNI